MMDVDGDAPSGAEIKENGDTSTKKQLPKDQDFYFNFYSSLQNQANMIGDISRTGTYRKAILGNAAVAIQDKRVLDVGAGSGVLSFMAAQAGAKEVIALEASSMAEKISVLVKQANAGLANPHIKNKVRVVRGLVEDEDTQKEVLQSGKVDTIVSEPIGVMLLHERMVESFLLARDMFLKPGGQLLPSGGHLFFCPFSDEGLYNETDQKAQFFNATLFGTDFRGLYSLARHEVFAQPVVGMFPPTSLLAAPCAPKSFDFHTCKKEDIVNFSVPIEFVVSRTALIHGLASWFDLDFFPNPATFSPGPPEDQELLDQWEYNVNPPATWPWLSVDTPLNPGPTPPPPRQGLEVKLSTGPQAPRTHWQQARLLLPEPLAANKGERVVGSVRFTANDARSYDLLLELNVDRPGSGSEAQTNPNSNPLSRKAEFNLSQQCFNYSYNPDTLTTASAGMGYTA
ncbi:S-adenosyl-L-methionine-dependent methyltransferase [Naematelia encephala]|uniref:type I protein arginine methyltransferase n=1 Tax=Naematelia encephala TaxID=71784 RepID=A0A1Y2AJ47_9TREE|nr:S-adenosyl-L-methionine-dependent methyltransferase [Naematelia encephala]